MDYSNTLLNASGRADGTQAVARAASLLREIALCETGEGSLAELAERLGLERPTAFRILRRLIHEGLVEQNPANKAYGLGPLLFELGLAAKPPMQLQGLASEALTHLAQESGDTAFAIIPSGMDSVCLDRQEGSYPVKALMMNIGRRRPLGIGAGSLALLSAMPEARAEQILDHNAVRIRQQGETDARHLRSVVAQGRADGFVARAPVDSPEILSLGVAVLNPYGTPVMSLSISALKFRIEPRLDELVALLRQRQEKVEKQLAQR
jgi:DNA-binding IclR family transcriptional regulator